MKCLDAHFARIIDIQPLTVGSWNSVITSSIDRTVKVWNMNYIFEQVHHIDRHELQIDSVSLCTARGFAVTVTRNCIGIWDLMTGKLRAKLADSALGAIVTHAVVTLDGRHILAAESGNVMYWSVDDQVVTFKEEQRDILQVAFYEDERHCLVVSKTGAVPDLKARAVSRYFHLPGILDFFFFCLLPVRSFPQGEKNFEFEFPYKQYKNIILTSDNQVCSSFDKCGKLQSGNHVKCFFASLHSSSSLMGMRSRRRPFSPTTWKPGTSCTNSPSSTPTSKRSVTWSTKFSMDECLNSSYNWFR